LPVKISNASIPDARIGHPTQVANVGSPD
jgi:hypothetical protein